MDQSCSSFRYYCSDDASREQMWFGEYQGRECWGREKPGRSRRVVLHGDIGIRFDKCQEGFRDCYSRNLQQCQPQGPKLGHLQSRVICKQGKPCQRWCQWVEEKPELFLLFQVISSLKEKEYKLMLSGWFVNAISLINLVCLFVIRYVLKYNKIRQYNRKKFDMFI